jgi:chromosome segregation ATPase
MSPIAIAVMAAVAAFQKLKGMIDDFSQAIEDTPWLSFKNRARESREEMAELTKETAAFKREMGDLERQQDSLSDKSSKAIKNIKADFAAQKQVMEAQKSVQLAKIQAGEQAGLLSPMQATKARAQVEAQFFGKGRQLAAAENAAVLNQKRQEAFGARIQTTQAQQAQVALEASKLEADLGVSTAQQQYDQNKDAQTKSRERLERLGKAYKSRRGFKPELKKQIEEENATLERLRGQEPDLLDKLTRRQAGAAQIGEQLTAARASEREGITIQKNAQEALTQQGIDFRRQTGVEATTFGLGQQEAQISAVGAMVAGSVDKNSQLTVDALKLVQEAIQRADARILQLEKGVATRPEP